MDSDTWNLTELAEFSNAQKVKKYLCKTKWFNIILVCLETGQEIRSLAQVIVTKRGVKQVKVAAIAP